METLFDRYIWQARVLPGMLTLIPLITAVIAWYPDAGDKVKVIAGSTIIGVALVSLIAAVARSAGKKVETRLLKVWGGLPSVQFMRWSDNNIDGTTKARYKNQLSRLTPEIVFPTVDEEQTGSIAAEEVYRASSKFLISQTRDHKKFWRLFVEVIDYGFRRNTLGLKPAGIFIAALGTAACCAKLLRDYFSKHASSEMAIICLIFDLLLIIAWTVCVSDQWVRDGAEAYAHALLESTDILSSSNVTEKPKRKTSSKSATHK